MADDYRPTEPVNVYEYVEPQLPEHHWKDRADEPLRPERTWKDNPLLWVGLVVAVFMAVPFLANWATHGSRVARKPTEQATGAPPTPSERADVDRAAPQRVAPAAVPDRPTPLPARPPVDPARQVVTKCIENGRVVYTQTGQCAGSVTAVPIDTSKNVVGPSDKAASGSP
jgi:cell division protein FtsN